MAIAAPAPGAKETVRQKRERDEELLVWPDLVFVEFICAVLFTITFVAAVDAGQRAAARTRRTPDITPNPSKAPWYFLNLQELLLHMNTALAGVIVPTVSLIVLMAIPYIDRSNEGRARWFGTLNSVRITVFSLRLGVRAGSSWLHPLGRRRHVACVRAPAAAIWGRQTAAYAMARRHEHPFELTCRAASSISAIWDFYSCRTASRSATRGTGACRCRSSPAPASTMATSTGRRTSRRCRCR